MGKFIERDYVVGAELQVLNLTTRPICDLHGDGPEPLCLWPYHHTHPERPACSSL
jgi:hypothetical protein